MMLIIKMEAADSGQKWQQILMINEKGEWSNPSSHINVNIMYMYVCTHH